MQENREAVEYFLSLMDDVERSMDGDFLAEKKRVRRYSVSFPPVDEASRDNAAAVEGFSSCRRCPLSDNKGKEILQLGKGRARIMFILSGPEGPNDILFPDAMDMFRRQVAAMGLADEDYVLTSLLKCPAERFDRSYADACRLFLKDEMRRFSAVRCYVLLGTDISSYMLRREGMDLLRSRVWSINGVASIATYSQRECLADPSLKKPVWDDLRKAMARIG